MQMDEAKVIENIVNVPTTSCAINIELSIVITNIELNDVPTNPLLETHV